MKMSESYCFSQYWNCFNLQWTTVVNITAISTKRILKRGCLQGWAARQIACELQTTLKFNQVPKNWIFGFSLPVSSQLISKICLYARCFDTSHCPCDIFWLHLVNSSKLWENNLIAENLNEVHWHILFSQSFGELTKCSQNMPCGQCEVSKHLAYRHILKLIVKKLEEKTKNSVFINLI